MMTMDTAPDTTSSQPDWEALRREFPTAAKFVYLDIARKAILPKQVEGYMQDWMADVYDNAGVTLSPWTGSRKLAAP